VKNKDTSAIFAKKVSDKLDTPLLLHSHTEEQIKIMTPIQKKIIENATSRGRKLALTDFQVSGNEMCFLGSYLIIDTDLYEGAVIKTIKGSIIRTPTSHVEISTREASIIDVHGSSTVSVGASSFVDAGFNCDIVAGPGSIVKALRGTRVYATGSIHVINRSARPSSAITIYNDDHIILTDDPRQPFLKIIEDRFYDDDGNEWLDIDRIWCKVINKKGKAYLVEVNDRRVYVVTDGVNFAHGATIKEAKASLIYKIKDRDTSMYKDLKLDSVIPFADAVKMYRAITGACESMTRTFAERNKKSKYTVQELIDLTDGQYGSSNFKQFFNHE